MKYAVTDVSTILSSLFKLNNICYNYVDVRWQNFKAERCTVRQINFKSQEQTTHLVQHPAEEHICYIYTAKSY
jgi:hypothetical protein